MRGMRLVGWANIAVCRIPSAEILRELGDSRWTVYDVLPTFFRHDDVSIELVMVLLGVIECLTDQFFQLL